MGHHVRERDTMGRRPRELEHDGSYHVTARGNNRQPVFVADHDRRGFLRDLDHVASRRSWRVFAYCLMGNHVHLGISTPHADLDAGMRDLLSRHARRLNWRCGGSGHVFTDRYFSKLIRDDAQLFATLRYIARNPVAAGLVRDAESWQWSSFHDLMTDVPALTRLDRDWILGLFHPRPLRARRLFAEFVALEDDGPPAPSATTLTQVLGPVEGVLAAANFGMSHREIGRQLGISRSAVTKRLGRRADVGEQSSYRDEAA
jgi:REP element-mobilizing transposase RayT